MPKYTYACATCDRAFEAYRPMSQRHVAKCEECGGDCARDAEIELDGISNPKDKYQMSVRLEDGRLVKGQFYA
jgi:putative FmdB family regulatory protein